MLRISCPHCGDRDETEFHYRGDASRSRPAENAGVEAFAAFVYARDNACGWQVEWWLHVGGCRALLKVIRHTVTHEIHAVGLPAAALALPPESTLR